MPTLGHLPGGFKCDSGGGTQDAEEERKHAELKLRELNAENRVDSHFMQRFLRKSPPPKKKAEAEG